MSGKTLAFTILSVRIVLLLGALLESRQQTGGKPPESHQKADGFPRNAGGEPSESVLRSESTDRENNTFLHS